METTGAWRSAEIVSLESTLVLALVSWHSLLGTAHSEIVGELGRAGSVCARSRKGGQDDAAGGKGAQGVVAAVIGLAVLVPAAGATSGSETIDVTLVVSGASGGRDVIAVVVAKGVFSGTGRLVEVDNLPTDPDNVSRDDLVFAAGTLHLRSTFGDFSVSVNPDSCRITATILQTAQVVGGTGQFAGPSGSFDSTLSGRAASPAIRTGAAPSTNSRSTRRSS
jgi:hypothetical protein